MNKEIYKNALYINECRAKSRAAAVPVDSHPEWSNTEWMKYHKADSTNLQDAKWYFIGVGCVISWFT